MMSESRRDGLVKLFYSMAFIFVIAISVGCSSAQNSASQTADDEGVAEIDEGDGEVIEEEPTSYLDSPICSAYESREMDPLHRWIQALPIERGGVVMVFTGATAEQMDVEASLEMAAIAGYEVQVCGTAVIVWVPGLDCHEQHDALVTRVEEGTTMTHDETSCFRIDEVRTRLAEECEQGNLPANRCP